MKVLVGSRAVEADMANSQGLPKEGEEFKTEQEHFWAGGFGNEYAGRNRGDQVVASNLAFFARALKHTRDIRSCIEVGPNIGLNLRALKLLFPAASLSAIEINATAARVLAEWMASTGGGSVSRASILDWSPKDQADLVLTKGVLIHIAPDYLPAVYQKLYDASASYILLAEYYNPTPVSVPYRGHADRLFKRDFAGEMLDRYPDLKLLDYGFVYKRDPTFPQDDMTWFLLQRN